MLRAFRSHAIKELHLLVRFLVLKEIPYNVSQTKRHSWALERVKGKEHSDCGFWNLPIYLGDDSFFIWESHGLLCRTQKPRTLSASKQLLHHFFGPDWHFACFIYNAVVSYPAGYWKMAFWNVSHIFRNHFQVITDQHLSMDHGIDGSEQVLQNCKANEIPMCFHKEVHCFLSLSGVGYIHCYLSPLYCHVSFFQPCVPGFCTAFDNLWNANFSTNFDIYYVFALSYRYFLVLESLPGHQNAQRKYFMAECKCRGCSSRENPVYYRRRFCQPLVAGSHHLPGLLS